MPGRGTPWRGVGKGLKDRIGTGEVKDDSLLSEDIKDGTVAEVDLTTALQAKVNSASGHEVLDEGSSLPARGRLDFVGAGVVASDGIEDTTTVTIAGGGGDPSATIDQFVWSDEFLYTTNPPLTDRYNVIGSVNAKNGGSQASSEIDTNSATIGDGGQLTLEGICPLDFFQGDDITYECKIGSFGETGEMVLFMGLSKVITISSATISESRLETNNSDMCGFIADPVISNNWRLITRAGGVSTTTQTTISAYSTHKLKWFFDKSASTVEFFIDGVSRGVHSTNVPNENTMIPQIAGWQTVIGSQTYVVDFWKLTQPRP